MSERESDNWGLGCLVIIAALWLAALAWGLSTALDELRDHDARLTALERAIPATASQPAERGE